MPRRSQPVLDPRKLPIQARSAATVDAILQATIQVLLQMGKEQLTTTKVAHRAGVSVGTLYQYFPNKGAMLKAALRRHLEEVAEVVELVCREQRGTSLDQMASAVVTAFLEAKMRDAKTSVALHAVSSDIDGAKIVEEMGIRFNRAIVEMLKTSRQRLLTDPPLVASMLQSVMAGVSRRLLESGAPEDQLDTLRREVIFLVCTYLNACSASRNGGRNG